MRIGIGIPVFKSYEPDVGHDYMRMFYSFGRRYPEHDFFLLSRKKSEQFRARNAIVETAIRFAMDYLLFLDDDHIINWEETPEHTPYEFLRTLLAHKKDIIGALYYHRTGDYRPVLMKEIEPGKYTFLNDSDIIGGLQQVDVQGGGCMLIDMKIFKDIKAPWFEPEQQTDGKSLGTDIQICRKAKEAGFSVWCDTSINIGHLKQDSEIVTRFNREGFIADNILRGGVADDWIVNNWLKDMRQDIGEFTGYDDNEITSHAIKYNDKNWGKFSEFPNHNGYYRNLGAEQLCRQLWYHQKPRVAWKDLSILKQFRAGYRGYGIDFGCGVAPIGYELLKLGHKVDFIDVEGAPAYEFLKWRVGNNGFKDRAGWGVKGPYEFALFMDSIEHFENWEEILDNVIGRLKENGLLITDFFSNFNYQNPEHINMDHRAVQKFLLSRNMIPKTEFYWQKDDNYMGGAMNINREVSENEYPKA